MITDRAAILGGELVYETAGDDDTNDPVVMLHGGLLDRRQWDTEFTAVAATHRVIRFDARGHGESSLADGDFAFHADLVALLDHLEVRRVTAVGLSLGARTIIDAALVHPHRFGALLLVSPGYSGIEFTDPFVLEQTAAMVTAAGDGDAEAFVEAFLRAWVDGPNRSPADVDPEVRSRCHDMAINAALRGFGSRGRLHEVGAAERFSELSMPVDVVLGELDSADTPKSRRAQRSRRSSALLLSCSTVDRSSDLALRPEECCHRGCQLTVGLVHPTAVVPRRDGRIVACAHRDLCNRVPHLLPVCLHESPEVVEPSAAARRDREVVRSTATPRLASRNRTGDVVGEEVRVRVEDHSGLRCALLEEPDLILQRRHRDVVERQHSLAAILRRLLLQRHILEQHHRRRHPQRSPLPIDAAVAAEGAEFGRAEHRWSRRQESPGRIQVVAMTRRRRPDDGPRPESARLARRWAGTAARPTARGWCPASPTGMPVRTWRTHTHGSGRCCVRPDRVPDGRRRGR